MVHCILFCVPWVVTGFCRGLLPFFSFCVTTCLFDPTPCASYDSRFILKFPIPFRDLRINSLTVRGRWVAFSLLNLCSSVCGSNTTRYNVILLVDSSSLIITQVLSFTSVTKYGPVSICSIVFLGSSVGLWSSLTNTRELILTCRRGVLTLSSTFLF